MTMLILIVDDEAGIRHSLHQLLSERHEVVQCDNGETALMTLEKTSIDLVIADHQMPKLSGLDLIRKGKEISSSTAFILMTAYGTVQQAVQAIRLGAEDYFMKPFDLTEIEHRVQRVEDLRSWKVESALRSESARAGSRLLGSSDCIRKAREFIEQVAPVHSPVLILGPSGSGKEVLARAIHESSPRATKPFIAINCASLTEQLIESELFGHEKGAFTGAVESKPGKFELAKGGTLFLDEIGELSPGIQARLLRVLQEKEFFRLGGIRQIKTDARVLAATHRDLKSMVKASSFREDLYFRLNVLSIGLAPLSERREDVLPLANHFWKKLQHELGKPVELSPEALEQLSAYNFPGNIRELQNVLERLAVLGSRTGTATAAMLPPEFFQPIPASELPSSGVGGGLTATLEELERKIVSEAMAKTRNNQAKAAELLKITRGALQYKLKKYGLGNSSEPGSTAA